MCPPPRCFVAALVRFVMMNAAQGNRELVADPAPEGARLRKAQMVGIGRRTAADDAGLRGHEFAMAILYSIGLAPRHRESPKLLQTQGIKGREAGQPISSQALGSASAIGTGSTLTPAHHDASSP